MKGRCDEGTEAPSQSPSDPIHGRQIVAIEK